MSASVHVIRPRKAGLRAGANLRDPELSPETLTALTGLAAALSTTSTGDLAGTAGAIPSSSSVPEETAMPAYKDGKYVSVPADGALLKVIEARAERFDVALGQAAADIIRELSAPGATDLPVNPAASAPVVLVNLETVTNDDLIDELVGRLQSLGNVEIAETTAKAALARAEAAEGQLDTLKAQIGQLLNPTPGGAA